MFLSLAAKNIPLTSSLFSYNEQMCSAAHLISALCKIQNSIKQVISANKHQTRVSKNEDVILLWSLGITYPTCIQVLLCQKLRSFLLPLGSGADPQRPFSIVFLVQFKDRCGIVVVQFPGSENGTWKGMDYLEIGEFKELFHIKLNEKAVADIFKNNFGFD